MSRANLVILVLAAVIITEALAIQECYVTNVQKLYSIHNGDVVDFDFAYGNEQYKIYPLKKPWSTAVTSAVKTVDKSINQFLAELFDDESVKPPKGEHNQPKLKCFDLQFQADETKTNGEYIACHYVAIVCQDIEDGAHNTKRSADGGSLMDKVRDKLGKYEPKAKRVSSTMSGYQVFTANVEESKLKFTLESNMRTHHGAIEETFVRLPEQDVENSYLDTAESAANETDGDIGSYRTPKLGAWGVDRTDQRFLPLQGKYYVEYPPSGFIVDSPVVYVIDTGVNTDHPELAGRVSTLYDYYPSSPSYCDPHGTHVSGIIAGSTVGINPYATIKSVRVLDCNGQGHTGGIAMGMEAIIDDCDPDKAIVINLSLGGPGSSSTVDDLFAIAKQVCHATVVVSAGNNAADACGFYPAGSQHVVSTGASDVYDGFATFSNKGVCVDIVAPGVRILSSVDSSSYASYSGTSMASPHVAGIASLYAGLYNAQISVPTNDTSITSASASNYGDVVYLILKGTGTTGALKFVPPETSNLLLYIDQAFLEQSLSPGYNFSFPPNLSSANTYDLPTGSTFVAFVAYVLLLMVTYM